MIQWLIFIVVTISLAAGVYGISLLYRLRRRYRLEFLNSFFYFQVLVLIFGIYGILSSVGIRELLQQFEIERKSIEIIAQFLPFMGLPFIIAAWYMSLKMAGELVGKKVPGFIAIIYFTLCTAAFLIYGLLIRQIPEISKGDYDNLRHQVQIAFYTLEMGIVAYIAIYLLTHISVKSHKIRKSFISRFAFILVITTFLTAIALHFADVHPIFFMYFILLYFTGDLPLILLTKNYLEKNTYQFKNAIEPLEDLFQRYGISKREREIIRKISEGKTNKQISEELFITLQTVKDHNYNIYKKVGVKNRVQLVQKFSQSKNTNDQDSRIQNF
ncbi:MAG: helix-turn-helix transcriptional regulator [Bacteroidales bacterium]|nr:helix-turn-helix transcriptional regulator [Bacteroidales bacterium]